MPTDTNTNATQTAPPHIVACIVLYGTTLAASETYRSLQQAAAQIPDLHQRFTLFVADNSPEACTPATLFNTTYVHDGENVGLARRYNQAVDMATRVGAAWLMTLDQDTLLTKEYIQEVLDVTEAMSSHPRVAVLLPKLWALGKLYSPHTSVYRKSPLVIDESSEGVLKDTLFGFNSAAVLRISSLHSIGGYDTRYWLDYLDHATFAALQRKQWRVYVLRSSLTHALAQAHGTVSEARASNIHRAEQMFYTEHSYGAEWRGRKLDLLRQVVGHARRGRIAVAGEKLRLLLGRLPT